MTKFTILIGTILILGLTLTAQNIKEKSESQPWQTNWKGYVAEISKRLAKGIDPSADSSFKGKQVEFEGILRKAFDSAKPDEYLDVEMESQEITVMVKLFPGVDAAAAGSKTSTVTVKKLSLKPEALKRDDWKNILVGSTIRFRSVLEDDAVVLFTMSDRGGSVRGLVFLYLNSVELLPPR